jgi:hypothetical protein
MFTRRRLPHVYEIDQPVFLTWRLHDSLPPHRVFPGETLTSGQAFAIMDRLLDEARSGAFYLRQPRIADMVVEAIHHNGEHSRALWLARLRGDAESRPSAGNAKGCDCLN